MTLWRNVGHQLVHPIHQRDENFVKVARVISIGHSF